MTIYTTGQYCPVSTSETGGENALSVRAINDLADAMNNYMVYVAKANKIVQHICIPNWSSIAVSGSETDEHVIWAGAPREVPEGPNYIRWRMGHVRTDGSDSVVWKLYCSRVPYRGATDGVMDTDFLSSGYSVGTITTSSDTHAITLADRQRLVRGDRDLVYLILTAANGDDSTLAKTTTIDVWPDFYDA